MRKPLQFGDPEELGPFRLEARLHESPAGIVYLATDPQGRAVEVALLTTAAAGDPAARDRFRAAVTGEAPRMGAFPRTPSPVRPGEPSPVVAALHDSNAPWVATLHEDGHAGAARFLEPVLLKRGWGMSSRTRGGPSFQQYWLSGPQGPAVHVPEPPATATAGGAVRGFGSEDTKGLAAAVVSLASLLLLLAMLVVLLFSCEPAQRREPRPFDVPTAPAEPPPPPESPLSPSPLPSHKKSPTPKPTQSGGDAPVNPAARPVRNIVPGIIHRVVHSVGAGMAAPAG